MAPSIRSALGYGRGLIKAKSYVLDNMRVCVFNSGLTPIERTMMEAGEAERVLEIRRDLQRVTKTRFRNRWRSGRGLRF
jgi:uncharacterized protein YbcI